MTSKKLDPRLVALIRKVKGKRPRTVIEHIIKHGQITTEELKDQYGYNHPPRAARDVREAGIPLKTTRVTGSDGRRIGAYVFADLDDIEKHKLAGRKVFSKEFKRQLLEQSQGRCAVCNERYADRYLQVDHRVPYEVAGESGRVGDESQPHLFMPLCGTCQRKKSWSCEHCGNWTDTKNATLCNQCYWASPDNYAHVALRQIRQVSIVWSEHEVWEFDAVAKQARRSGLSVQEYIKRQLGEK